MKIQFGNIGLSDDVFADRMNTGLDWIGFRKMDPGTSLRPSKLIDFGAYRKRICDFMLVINSNLGHVSPFWFTVA